VEAAFSRDNTGKTFRHARKHDEAISACQKTAGQSQSHCRNNQWQ
jgi:hypothetical protein